MAMQESGVRLRVDGLSKFLNDLGSGDKAINDFGKGGGKSLDLGSSASGLGASINRELGTVQARFGAFNSFLAGAFAGAGSALATSLISGLNTAASAIPKLIGKAFSEAIDLEQASANAFAISQPTQQQQLQLSALAESVALNPNLQVSQGGALEAIDAALQAGIDAQQLINDGVIQAIVSQQNALGGSFFENARLISKQLGDQVGIENPLTAQQIANQNVGTFRAGQFRNVNDLLLAQAASGGSLKQLGVTQQQFNEFLAVAGTAASGGSDAGTSVKSFINAATNASKEQRKAQNALGFNIADQNGEFNDTLALSQQLSLARTEGINRIIETGGGTKEQQAELKRLNRLINSNLNAASNLEQGLTGVNLSDKARAKKIEAANVQAQNAKAQFDQLLGTVPGLQKTALKIKASETEFAGLLFQAFGTDGGRFAAALAGLSEEDAKRVTELITTADALEVAAIKTDTVRAKLEGIGDIFGANITKIAKPSLGPLKETLASFASFGQAITPVFDFIGVKIAGVVSGPLAGAKKLLDGLTLNLGNFFSGFSQSIRLSDILQIDPGKFELSFTRDLFGLGNDKIHLNIGDVVFFEKSPGGTKLKLTDYFIVDTTNNQINVDIGKLIHFTGATGIDGQTSAQLTGFGRTLATLIYSQDRISIDIGRILSFDLGKFGSFSTFKFTGFGQTLLSGIYNEKRVSVDIGKLLDFTFTPGAQGTVFSLSGFSDSLKAAVQSNGAVSVDVGNLLDFTFTPGAKGTIFNLGGFNDSLKAAIQSNGVVSVDIGNLLDISGSITPGGTLNLSLNGKNFSVDFAQIGSDIQAKVTSFGSQLRTTFDGFKAAFDIGGLPAVIALAGFRVNLAFQSLKDKIGNLDLSTAKETIGSITGTITEFITGLTTGDVTGAVTTVTTFVGGIKDGIASLVGLDGTQFSAGLTALSLGIAGISGAVSSVALGAFVSAGLGIGLMIAQIGSLVNFVNTIDIEKFSSLGQTISDSATGLLNFGTDLVKAFDAEGFAGVAGDFVTGFVNRITATFAGANAAGVADAAGGFISTLVGKFTTVLTDPSLGTGIGSSIGGLVTTLLGKLGDVLSSESLATSLGDASVGIPAAITGLVTNLVTGLGSEIAKFDWGKLGGQVDKFTENFGSAVSSKMESTLDPALASFQSWLDGLVNALDGLPGVDSLITSPQEKKDAAAKAAAQDDRQQAIQESRTSKGQPPTSDGTWLTWGWLKDTLTAPARDQAKVVDEVMKQNNQDTAKVIGENSARALGWIAPFVSELQHLATLTSGGAQTRFGPLALAGTGSMVQPVAPAPSGEPQVTFDPVAAANEMIRRATQGQPIQGPITQQQAAQPSGGGSGFLAPTLTKQAETANLQASINKAAASYDAMSAAANANAKTITTAKPVKYDVLSSAVTKTATSLSAPTSKPPSYNPLAGAINSASSKLNSMGQPPQFGNLTAAANSAAARLNGFTIPVIPPFPGWAALVGAPSAPVTTPPSTGGGGNKPVDNTGGGGTAKQASATPALGGSGFLAASFAGQVETANLQMAINSAAASYGAMSATADANAKAITTIKPIKYDVLSSAVTKTATSLSAPTSKPPSYNPLASAISGSSAKLNQTQQPPSYNPLASAISGSSAKLNQTQQPPSYNPLASAISGSSAKLNSIGPLPQFGNLTSAAASAAAKLAGFSVPSIPPFPGWGALVGTPSQPSTGGGGGTAKLSSVDLTPTLPQKEPTIPVVPKPFPETQPGPLVAAWDDTRLIGQLQISTREIVGAIEDRTGTPAPIMVPSKEPSTPTRLPILAQPQKEDKGAIAPQPSPVAPIQPSKEPSAPTRLPILAQPQKEDKGAIAPQPRVETKPGPLVAAWDDTRLIGQLQISTREIVKTLEESAQRGNVTRRVSNTFLAIGGGSSVSTADLLNSVLQSDELRNMISAAIRGNVAPAGASSPGNNSSGGGDWSIFFPGRDGIGFGAGAGAAANPFNASISSAAIKSAYASKASKGNQQIQSLLVSPPQVTNNYYNNTRNYNLSVQTLQSDASVIEQFGYMERLAASV